MFLSSPFLSILAILTSAFSSQPAPQPTLSPLFIEQAATTLDPAEDVALMCVDMTGSIARDTDKGGTRPTPEPKPAPDTSECNPNNPPHIKCPEGGKMPGVCCVLDKGENKYHPKCLDNMLDCPN